ncbi:unnamed protein product [Linum tenue]|uniref:RRM domain-containing protein n=1 Tax=Linum tenue TaxID=586396 RepID=A0AAV0L8J3_9ROSI|nr:unnamed protein product [Linum tenue]
MSRPTSFRSPSLLQPATRFLSIAIRSPLQKPPTFPPLQFQISLRRTRNPNPHSCSAVSDSSPVEPSPSPPTIVFIKGLSLSTTEVRLKTVFSQFGEISRGERGLFFNSDWGWEIFLKDFGFAVKIIVDNRTMESLGFAYVWFASKASADLAVEGMNGKFFDGRFVLVTIARPGSCKIDRNKTAAHFRF